MARKKVKMLDPQWQAARRKDHHRLKTAVTVRLEPAQKERWKDMADQCGMTLSEWIIAACEDARHRGS